MEQSTEVIFFIYEGRVPLGSISRALLIWADQEAFQCPPSIRGATHTIVGGLTPNRSTRHTQKWPHLSTQTSTAVPCPEAACHPLDWHANPIFCFLTRSATVDRKGDNMGASDDPYLRSVPGQRPRQCCLPISSSLCQGNQIDGLA